MIEEATSSLTALNAELELLREQFSQGLFRKDIPKPSMFINFEELYLQRSILSKIQGFASKIKDIFLGVKDFSGNS